MYLGQQEKLHNSHFTSKNQKGISNAKKSDAAVESPVGVPCSWFKQCGKKFLLLAELCRKSPCRLPPSAAVLYMYTFTRMHEGCKELWNTI